MAKRGRPRQAYSRVYERGNQRIVVNYAVGYVCEMGPDTCRITKFTDLKRLTPAMVEHAAKRWGYVLVDTARKGKAA